MIDRTEDPQKFRDQLFAPAQGRDPEQVSDDVIQQEMNAFLAFMAET